MENAEEILQCLDEFSKLKPKDIPRELEEYLCFVAKTGDPVYQWPLIKCLFREKLLSVITEFYEACPTVDIPPCPNVDPFNYDVMKNFILEKLDTFAAAPFTVQRICELLTTPRKEYNRIDKYMRALEKNILVVSTREPGNRKSTENGESIVNGLESEHINPEINSDINVEVDMEESSVWQKTSTYTVNESNIILDSQSPQNNDNIQDTYVSESKQETVITSRSISYIGYTPNITDLIIAPSNISNNSESETPMTTETQNVTVLSMNPDYSLPEQEQIENPEEAPYDDKLSVNVTVHPDCLETANFSVVQLEPEPSLVQNILPPEQKSESESKLQEIKEEQQEIEVRSEPEPSIQIEPEPSTSVHLEPESSTEQPETTISSTEEIPNNSQPVSAIVELPPEAEDQVSESNIQSEYEVSQTDQPEEPQTEPETITDTVVELMQVDENVPEVTESCQVDEPPQISD